MINKNVELLSINSDFKLQLALLLSEKSSASPWTVTKKVVSLRTGFKPVSYQSCPTLCDPIDGSPPGSSVPGILQARILEWVLIYELSAFL